MSPETRDSYRPIEIEEKWQRIWEERGTNLRSDESLRSAERPFFNLMMFPYPSAEGLHVGNMYAFTGADIYGRWRRLQGDDVFEPIGFDAFGIHSENFALKIGTHPMELIPKNVANFTRQLRRIGAMYDWNHTVDTTDPSYYRWTQWLFLQLFRQGLAEKREAPVNWCPSCHTVLANEQVIAGACERCGTAVEQRRLSQWFFRITNYAERLLANLSWIDWSESTLKAQDNWIGRSDGAEIHFPIARAKAAPDRHEASEVQPDRNRITVFTTRPDTLFGATFMVLAPEHPLVDRITTEDRRAEVEAYRAAAAAKDLVARKIVEKQKTGVFTGGHCVNPATGEDIPIWVADYVLMEYGTGAIMAVPGHDERDFEFATQFGLPIIRVVAERPEDAVVPLAEAYVGPGALVNSGSFDGLPADDGARAITAWLEERALGEAKVNYRLHDWCISRQRYWGPPIPIIYCDECGTVPVPEEDLPVVLPHIEDYKPDESGVSPLARVEDWYRVPCPPAAARRDARPTSATRSSTAPGTSSATRPPTAPTAPSIRSSRGNGCRWTCTSAARSTPCCTCSTAASSPWRCTTPVCSTSRSPTPLPQARAPHQGRRRRCRRAAATWSSPTNTSRSGARTPSAPTSCSWDRTRKAATSATPVSRAPSGSSADSGTPSSPSMNSAAMRLPARSSRSCTPPSAR